ncbi:FAD/NAD(P)-binding domain-containing protein [Aspergillus uvarum CBS 121591]|uniref:FAD/NAD(P)-binding domain-containing protein n=1 Tax=Aspergillus uvarum CBS 121591 TaxID=1448315 RepID=A0A319CMW9_9EURO|nr:FAD/NAD(P)-binding domain-containing protein [Aspergillus uvarum CBS 121591]PYH86745.1 FAD/NAD(P)-binding domain-containing protein [Aspergillus uvarum CBS 121591]
MDLFLDVVIIGAGMSGINFAHRLQQSNPTLSFVVLDARNSIGGTWDFFKYPGIRSDSDLYTYGFSWYPWTEDRAIADAASIKHYLNKAIEYTGLASHIKLRHKVTKADFSKESAKWTLTVEEDGRIKSMISRYTIFGTGYYDYEQPLSTTIPELSQFKGQIVHPQFWPDDLNYKDKRIVIIGSGATAVTLLPNLAKQAKQAIMLQRSPGYIVSMDNRASPLLKWLLPKALVCGVLRFWFLTSLFLQFQFCRKFPEFSKRKLKDNMRRQLPPDIDIQPHFSPKYNPWEQRLCLCPDGDFFACLRAGTASVVTSRIRGFRENSLLLEKGNRIDDVDIIVTATGLKLVFAGKVQISVDGTSLDTSKKLLWRGCMLEDTPNACFLMGYTNASWTLGADASAVLFCRLLSDMQRSQQATVTPCFQGDTKERTSMKTASYLNLNSTYVAKATAALPKIGDRGPWRMRRNYYLDYCIARWGNLSNSLSFGKDDVTQKKNL